MHAATLFALAVASVCVRASPIGPAPVDVASPVAGVPVAGALALGSRCDTCNSNSGNPGGLGLGLGLGLDTTLDSVLKPVTGLVSGLTAGLDLSLGSSGGNPSSPPSGSCNTAGCNEKDIIALALDLTVKVKVILKELDGHSDPSKPCASLVDLLKVYLGLFADIKIDLTGQHGSQWAQLISICAGLYINIVVALSKYSVLTVAGLDAVLSELVAILNVRIGGFSGACGHALTNTDLFIRLGLNLTLKACNLL